MNTPDVTEQSQDANAGCVKRVVRRKRTYRNPIRFNCSNYHRLLMSQPANCYNCMMRHGYPQNLGGDKACANFEPNGKLCRPADSEAGAQRKESNEQ